MCMLFPRLTCVVKRICLYPYPNAIAPYTRILFVSSSFFPFPPSVLYYPIIVRCHLILSKGTMFLYLVIMRLVCLAGYPCHEYIVRLLSHF